MTVWLVLPAFSLSDPSIHFLPLLVLARLVALPFLFPLEFPSFHCSTPALISPFSLPRSALPFSVSPPSLLTPRSCASSRPLHHLGVSLVFTPACRTYRMRFFPPRPLSVFACADNAGVATRPRCARAQKVKATSANKIPSTGRFVVLRQFKGRSCVTLLTSRCFFFPEPFSFCLLALAALYLHPESLVPGSFHCLQKMKPPCRSCSPW